MLAKKTIRKHVIIIHAYSLMSVLQRKIFNVLLYEAIHANNRINHQKSIAIECNISFSTLCKAVKFTSNNTQYLKESIDELASLKIEWNLLKDKVPTDISFLNLRVLHGAPTFYQDKTLNFSFHKLMLNFIEDPQIYGTIDIDLQSDFESKYSHALYENCTRFINLQKNKIIQLETFRKILGVPDDKYPNMRELTRNVIMSSIEEVNDRANFIVNLETLKNGRKITGFEVSVISKKKSTVENTQKPNELIGMQKEIELTFGKLSESLLKNIFNNYSEDYILEKIYYTKKHAKKDTSGFYPIPYLISAIKHDYKIKQEHQPVHPLKGKLVNQKNEWQTELTTMQTDLNHWIGLLERAKKNNDQAQVKNIETIILKCEEKIKLHYLDQREGGLT